MQIFLSFTDVGSEFVFGPSYAEHLFAFKVNNCPVRNLDAKRKRYTGIYITITKIMVLIVDSLQVMPILIFLSSVISILYYIGFMPWLICKVRKKQEEMQRVR